MKGVAEGFGKMPANCKYPSPSLGLAEALRSLKHSGPGPKGRFRGIAGAYRRASYLLLGRQLVLKTLSISVEVSCAAGVTEPFGGHLAHGEAGQFLPRAELRCQSGECQLALS